jgi:DNA-binding HxlR family transcriptional regulator
MRRWFIRKPQDHRPSGQFYPQLEYCIDLYIASNKLQKDMRDNKRSGCPIANALEIVGDRWTLVLIRDLINGKTKYSEFLDSPERITTNVLADRLSKMTRAGLVTRIAYSKRPPRFEYQLTSRGRDLLPLAQAMCRWGNAHISDTWVPPDSFMAPRTDKPGS